MALRDELAERLGERGRVLTVSVNGEAGEVDGLGRRLGVDFIEGEVEDGAVGFAQVVGGMILNHSARWVRAMLAACDDDGIGLVKAVPQRLWVAQRFTAAIETLMESAGFSR